MKKPQQSVRQRPSRVRARGSVNGMTVGDPIAATLERAPPGAKLEDSPLLAINLEAHLADHPRVGVFAISARGEVSVREDRIAGIEHERLERLEHHLPP